MGQSKVGLPTAENVLTFSDALGAWFKRAYAPLGRGASAEASTLAYYAQAAKAAIMGDGSTVYGLDNAQLQALLQQHLSSLVMNSRYDTFTSYAMRFIIGQIEQYILQYGLPSDWDFTGGGLYPLDALLLRLNATNASVPATPSGTLAVTATTGGSMASVASGNAPRVKLSVVGAYDYIESLPTAGTSQVAISGINNAYVISGLTGNVASGVTKARVYRQLYGAGADDPYYWDQDVTVTAGDAWSKYLSGGASPILLKKTDLDLRQDVQPPSWCQALMMPEFAACFALAYATSQIGGGSQNNAVILQTALSPENVALQEANSWLGIGNPESLGLFGQLVLGTGYTAGAISDENDLDLSIQGLIGSYGKLQARVTATLSGGTAAEVTAVTYKYYDSTHLRSGAAQTATITGLSESLDDAVGSVVDLSTAASCAGRLITEVTSLTVANRTAGTVIVEGMAVRTI